MMTQSLYVRVHDPEQLAPGSQKYHGQLHGRLLAHVLVFSWNLAQFIECLPHGIWAHPVRKETSLESLVG